jgi:hypothetical protein
LEAIVTQQQQQQQSQKARVQAKMMHDNISMFQQLIAT